MCTDRRPAGALHGRLAITMITAAITAAACTQTETRFRPCRGSDLGSATVPTPPSGPLQADDSGRFILTSDGDPFFWLGDTAWLMGRRASPADVDRYLLDRHTKMFNVIQILVALDTHRPLYWSKIDSIVDKAASLGMYVAMVPCWHCFEDTAGCWECLGKPGGIDRAQIRAYGDFLGSRYGDRYVVWLLGGDAAQDGLSREAHDRYSLLANSIATAAGGHDQVLIGVQPTGESSSSRWFHTDGWLDLNTLQSGHGLDRANYDLIAEDYRKTPVKPTHEGESIYEDIPELFGVSVDNPRASAWDERKSAYWGVFAGGFGHTYGANGIWSWTLDGEVGNTCCGIRYPWYEALDFPGASQMQHLRRLMESRPFLDRIPDQGIIASAEGRAGSRVQATRASDRSYAMVYISDGHEITVDLSKVRGTVRAWWFDPRQGTSAVIGRFSDGGTRSFTPPTSGVGQDWVLVLDDAGRGFPRPGCGA